MCVATILAGGISTFWPGTPKFEHTPFPDLICTNICWGGKDMKNGVHHHVVDRKAGIVRLALAGTAAGL